MSLMGFVQTAATTISNIVSSPVFSAITKVNSLGAIKKEGSFILNNPELTFKQKIIPSTGIVIAGGATLIGLTSLVISIPWIPSLMMVASIGGFAYDLAFYLEERAERAALREEFATTLSLVTAINTHPQLNEEQKHQLIAYSVSQAELIIALSQLRLDMISDTALSLDDKQILNEVLNAVIEALQQDNLVSFDECKRVLGGKFFSQHKKTMEIVESQIEVYKQAKNIVAGITIPPALVRKIQHFRSIQQKVAGLDLTAKEKALLLKALEANNIDTQSLKPLLASIGWRFINQTIHWQVHLQDVTLNQFISKHFSPSGAKEVIRFYQLPREIIYHVHELKEIIKKEPNSEQKDALLQTIQLLNNELADSAYNPKVASLFSTFSRDFRKLFNRKHASKLRGCQTLLNQLAPFFEQFQIISPNDETSNIILAHRSKTLLQYAYGLEKQFSAPKRVAKKASIEHLAVFQEVSELRKELEQEMQAWIESLKNKLFDIEADPLDVKNAKAKLQQYFTDKYGDAIDIILKAQRLKYLEMAAPRHCANVGADVASAALLIIQGLSFLSSMQSLNTVKYGLPVLSVANGLELAWRKSNKESDLNQALSFLEQSIIPQSTLKTRKKLHS